MVAIVFGDLFQAAMLSLILKGWPYENAIPEAYRLACGGANYLRQYGVDVDGGRHIVEGGAGTYVPPPSVTVPPPAQTPVPVALQVALPASTQVAAPAQVHTPNVEVLPPIAQGDAVAQFFRENFRPNAWVAEGDHGAAQAFVDQLRNRFGMNVG